MKIVYRPIEKWPGELRRVRNRSPFSAPWSTTLALLRRELDYLHATNVVFQIALQESDFRVTDGDPRANAKAAHPGVILSFDSKYGPQQYPCDTYSDFQSNVRAIALSLESLRKVDRYGVTKRGEQYTGWKQIGSGIAMPAHKMTVDEAVRFIYDVAGIRLHDVPLATAYRYAAKRVHPDAGGDAERFKRLQEAKRVVDECVS